MKSIHLSVRPCYYPLAARRTPIPPALATVNLLLCHVCLSPVPIRLHYHGERINSFWGGSEKKRSCRGQWTADLHFVLLWLSFSCLVLNILRIRRGSLILHRRMKGGPTIICSYPSKLRCYKTNLQNLRPTLHQEMNPKCLLLKFHHLNWKLCHLFIINLTLWVSVLQMPARKDFALCPIWEVNATDTILALSITLSTFFHHSLSIE